MKKTLALVLALAMVFSTITVAFAEDTLSADAQICADLGMLKGETGTVDAAYTATAPSRIQAAVMFLRLKGLEEEAKAFTGEDNFADADKAAWAKPIMAYLKANPQLGWLGDGTNFNPTDKITAQMYYKVLLESLGYKQNTAEVVGDFTWENVIEFAAGIGLSKVAAVTNFTVNDLAVATVEALKATVKEGGKTLIASLIEAGKVDAAKAEELGLYEGSSTSTEAKLDSVIASANDKVEVTFDAEVAKAFAENADNYKIVVKGSTTALEVKEAKAISGKMVELTTAAQTGGTSYTLTVGEVAKNFSGLAKNNGVPEVDTVKCIDTDTIEIVFKKALDRASAEDVANYTLNNGATVKAAELWIDQDDSRQTVKLTTEGVANNKVYKLKIANVKSADMVTMKSVEKSVTGIRDTVAPKINGTIVVKNNQRLWVKFDDKHGLDKESAENIANWSIDGLTITKITALDDDGNKFGVDDYGYYDIVEIDTEPMTPNHKYTLTISNLADGSTSKNVIAKPITKTFYAVSVDKTAPKVGAISVLGDCMVEIPFNENNRLDPVSATDVNNYTFSDGLQVLSAQILKSSKPDQKLGKTVVLTTSTMDKDTTYKLTIENVADEFGNVMTAVKNRSIARTKGQDIKPPAVTRVTYVDNTTLYVYFDERVDVETAEDPTNYTLSGDLGAVRKAEVSTNDTNEYKRVTLTTPEMTANKNYTLTINGVKDRLGNEMANYKAYVTAGLDSVDNEMPVIENIEAVNNQEIHVTFDEKVKADATASITFGYGNTTYTYSVAGIPTANYTIDGGTTVVFSGAVVKYGEELTVTKLTGVKDHHKNTYVVDKDDQPKFYGNPDTNNDAPEVIGIDQINMKKLQVTFSEPILDGPVGSFTTTVDIDDDETTEALSVLTLESGKIKADTKFTFNFSGIKDYANKASTDKAYEYIAYLDDTDDPVIEYVESVSTDKIQVHYNESMEVGGTYTIKGIMKNQTKESTFTVAGIVDGDDDTIVNLNVAGKPLDPGEVYTLIPKTAAKDVAGNSSDLRDVEFEFIASAVQNFDYIKGVAIIDGRTIEVRTSSAFVIGGTDPRADQIEVYYKDENDNQVDVFKSGTVDGKVITVDLTESLIDDVTYYVELWRFDASLDADSDETDNSQVDPVNDFYLMSSYSFEGVVEDGGISVDGGVITFSGWNATDFVVKVVYDDKTYIVRPTDSNDTDSIADEFDLDTDLILEATGVEQTFGISDFAPGTEYTVEVYRTLDSIVLYDDNDTADPADDYYCDTAAEYVTDIATAEVEAAPAYALKVTVPTP